MSKRNPSTLYWLRPQHDGIDHELFHHGVFGGGVRAAALAEHAAVAVEPVVVAGHELVEDGVRILAGGVGVVVDHVHHHAQAALVQRLHHLAELEDALRAVGIDGVAALGHVVVQRVVAPVEAVADRQSPRPAPAARKNPPGSADSASNDGDCHVDLSSLMVAKSNAGSRCTCVTPARPSVARCFMPSERFCVKAANVPRRSAGTWRSVALKSRTCSSYSTMSSGAARPGFAQLASSRAAAAADHRARRSGCACCCAPARPSRDR